MSEFGREGRTVVFVSHDLGAIAQICRRALWFEHGEVRADGPSEEVIERYVRSAVARTAISVFDPDPGKPAQLVSAAVVDESGNVMDAPRRDEPFTICLRFIVREPIPGLDVAVFLQNHSGLQLLEEDWGLDTGGVLVPERFPQEYEARITVPPLLPAGDYFAGFWIGSTYETVIYQPQALGFRLWPRADERANTLERNRLLQPGVEWNMRTIEVGEELGAVSGDGV